MNTTNTKRALRRANRTRVLKKWLTRIKQKRRMRNYTESDHLLEAVRRVETHRDLRNHSRKTCSICNPVYKRLAEERELDREFDQELELLDVNLHDLLRPTPD
jgi:hypothetical protein